MTNLTEAVWVEVLKARRSRLPLLTVLGFSLVPLAGGFFMLVLKDPVMAMRAGLISAKAQMLTGSADWPTYLGLIAQATAVGGIFLFGLIASWVFGREYSDRTIKDLLALPTSRSAIVFAKFVVVAAWCALLTSLIVLLALAVGAILGLAPVPVDVIFQGGVTVAITAALTIALVTPIALFASAGHGYLPPMSVAILASILAQVIAVAGWGDYFPWSIPALYAGLAGKEYAPPGFSSYAIVLLMSFVGLVGTFLWWELADQVY